MQACDRFASNAWDTRFSRGSSFHVVARHLVPFEGSFSTVYRPRPVDDGPWSFEGDGGAQDCSTWIPNLSYQSPDSSLTLRRRLLFRCESHARVRRSSFRRRRFVGGREETPSSLLSFLPSIVRGHVGVFALVLGGWFLSTFGTDVRPSVRGSWPPSPNPRCNRCASMRARRTSHGMDGWKPRRRDMHDTKRGWSEADAVMNHTTQTNGGRTATPRQPWRCDPSGIGILASYLRRGNRRIDARRSRRIETTFPCVWKRNHTADENQWTWTMNATKRRPPRRAGIRSTMHGHNDGSCRLGCGNHGDAITNATALCQEPNDSRSNPQTLAVDERLHRPQPCLRCLHRSDNAHNEKY